MQNIVVCDILHIRVKLYWLGLQLDFKLSDCGINKENIWSIVLFIDLRIVSSVKNILEKVKKRTLSDVITVLHTPAQLTTTDNTFMQESPI